MYPPVYNLKVSIKIKEERRMRTWEYHELGRIKGSTSMHGRKEMTDVIEALKAAIEFVEKQRKDCHIP